MSVLNADVRVSVALCTFNGAAYVKTQLESLASQTRRPDEIVVNDDASEDDTVSIIERFASESGLSIFIERNAHQLGIHGNFGRAIERCTGDLILPCDQDDFWLAEKIERQIHPLLSDPRIRYTLVQSEMVDENLNPTAGKTIFDEQRFGRALRRHLADGAGLRAFLRHNVAPGHAAAFRAIDRDVLLPIPTTCIYDQWIALVCATLGKTAYIETPLVKYRMHVKQSIGKEKTLLDWAASRPKLDHLQRQLDTLEELTRRIDGRAEFSPERRRLIDARMDFLRARHSMRGTRVRRTLVAMRLLATGSYHRQGRGLLSFARDLRGVS